MHGRFRDFTNRHVGARERLFNPETPPADLWPGSPPSNANWDWLIFILMVFGIVAALGSMAIIAFLSSLVVS